LTALTHLTSVGFSSNNILFHSFTGHLSTTTLTLFFISPFYLAVCHFYTQLIYHLFLLNISTSNHGYPSWFHKLISSRLHYGFFWPGFSHSIMKGDLWPRHVISKDGRTHPNTSVSSRTHLNTQNSLLLGEVSRSRLLPNC